MTTTSVEDQAQVRVPDEPQREVAREPKPPPVKAKPADDVDEYASFDDLLNKPARERDLTITVGAKTLKMHLRAIGSHAYDQLTAGSPTTLDEQARGITLDIKTFAPKLIAACVTRPRMDLDQATRLWNDPNWAGGEAGGLYRACVELCQAGFDVPFSAGG